MSPSRGTCGIREESQHAVLAISGKDRVEFLNRLCTNDLTKVTEAHGQAAVLTNVKGRVIDAVQVCSRGDHLVLLGSRAMGTPIREWLEKFIVMEDCTVVDRSASESTFLVFGPKARDSVAAVFGASPKPEPEGFETLQVGEAGAPVWLAGTAAPLGFGVRIQVAVESAARWFQRFVDSGLTPVGDEAFEQLRIESGIPVLGREFGEHVNPLEGGLRSSVSFRKGCYIGQEVVARLETYQKVRRTLAGARFPLEVNPSDLKELFQEELRIGSVTSAVRSPRLDATLALAILVTEYAIPDTKVEALIQGQRVQGTIAELPFRGGES